jgi:hypothetical protein
VWCRRALQGATTWILLLASFEAVAALLLCRFQRVVLPSLSADVFIFFCVLSLQLRGLPARDDVCGSLLMYLLCAAAPTEKRVPCVSPFVGSSSRLQSFATEKPQQKPVTTDGQTATASVKRVSRTQPHFLVSRTAAATSATAIQTGILLSLAPSLYHRWAFSDLPIFSLELKLKSLVFCVLL